MTTLNEDIRACGYQVLVRPLEVPEKTAKGIFIPDTSQDAARAAAIVVEVIQVGPDAYTGDKYVSGPWCNAGDFVIIGRWAGRRFKYRGDEFRFLNDDDVLGIVSDPEAVSSIMF